MASRRIERVNRRIKEVASRAILYELKDPRVGFCTVTKVETSADLKTAKIHVSVMGRQEDERNTFRALEHARGHIQGKIAAELATRFSPVIEFIPDQTIKASIRIGEILRKDRET